MENSHLERLVNFVSQAQKSLKLASPWIKGDILERMIQALNEDVSLEVIIKVSQEQDLKITDYRTFKTVRKRGGKLFINPRLHAKMVIVDDEKALVGSANITYGGMEENLEFLTQSTDVKEVLQTYDMIKKESVRLMKSAKALLYQYTEDYLIEGLLLDSLPLESLLKVPTERGFLIVKLVSVRTQELIPSSEFSKDVYMLMASLYAQAEERGKFTYGLFKPLLEYLKKTENKESKTALPTYPVELPSQALPLEEEEIFSTNMAGYPMNIPVECGYVVGVPARAYVDMDKVCGMHMAVLGSTGSGKTTFVKRMLEKLQDGKIQTFVLDVYGEYRESFNSEGVDRISFPNTVFPISVSDIKELLKEEGIDIQERSSEERELFSYVRKNLKPDINLIVYREKGLRTFLEGAPSLKDELKDLIQTLSNRHGEEVVNNQKKVREFILKGVHSQKPIVIFDLRDLILINSRLNIVGFILKEIFNISIRNGRKRLVVLEEAHHFAPERGVDHMTVENLSFQMTRRIALEGRKFNIGLLAITQRPANLSKYLLSQMNSQAIFRLITKNDIEAVSPFFGPHEEDYLNLLPALKTGTCFVAGIAFPFTMMCKVEL